MRLLLPCHITVIICDKSEIFHPTSKLTVQPVTVLSSRRHKTHGSEIKYSLLFTVIAESRVLAFVWTCSSSDSSTRQCQYNQKIAPHTRSYIIEEES